MIEMSTLHPKPLYVCTSVCTCVCRYVCGYSCNSIHIPIMVPPKEILKKNQGSSCGMMPKIVLPSGGSNPRNLQGRRSWGLGGGFLSAVVYWGSWGSWGSRRLVLVLGLGWRLCSSRSLTPGAEQQTWGFQAFDVCLQMYAGFAP